MKNFKEKFSSLKNVSIVKAISILILLIFIVLLVINQQNIQFYFNNFGQVFGSDLQVYFLDVGQASATFVVLPNDFSILIDTGTAESGEGLVRDLDFLLSKNNLNDIDMMILTHPDSDHTGGVVAVLEKFQVNSVLRPKVCVPEEENYFPYLVSNTYTYLKAIEAIYAEPNCQMNFVENQVFVESDKNFESQTTIEIFAAEKDNYGSDTNSFSPYISLSYAGKTFLFTGDAPQARETELMNRLANENRSLSVDFLQVAHHGSKYSTYPNFLAALSPKYAFISAGDKLHPSQNVLKRLEDALVKETYVTKSDGTIGVGVKGNGEFLICTKRGFVDVPLLVILLSLLIFVLMRFIYVSPSSQKFSAQKERKIAKEKLRGTKKA